MDHKVTTDYTRLLHDSNVKVYVRARPCADGSEAPDDMFERKREAPKNIVIKDTERMQYGNHAFSFDNVYWTDTTQLTLFETTSKPLVDFALKGINSCCFAYGQTGSGKTFSIFGEPGEKTGLLSRSIDHLFNMVGRIDKRTKEVTLVVSFLEIYCDRVRDLARVYTKKAGRQVSYQTSSSTDWFLRQQQQQMNRSESASSFGSNVGKTDDEYDYEKANFEIHEDAQGNVFVKDLSMVTVTSREEIDLLVQSGLKLRATHETKMNAVSSRSHTVFTIHVFQQNLDTEEIIYGQLNMVDLAGSERLKKSESDGQRLKEALHINSSLSAVGKVVMSLDPESGYNYIPYRDSKLTRLLQNSIGGNSFTILIATIHPMKEHYEECLSTLQFANRCRSVQNQPRVNHINGSVADKDRRIRRLQDELAVLRRQLEGLRAEYNQRFVRALNELGFDAEEVTDAGEIKFTDGTTLRSVFSNTGLDVTEVTNAGGISSGGAMSPSRRHGAGSGPGSATAHGHMLRHANAMYFHYDNGGAELSKRDRDQLRQKYANAKTNFSVVVTAANKDKEESRKTANDLRRRISQLEDALVQKTREFERALASEAVRHRAEIHQFVANNATLLQTNVRLSPRARPGSASASAAWTGKPRTGGSMNGGQGGSNRHRQDEQMEQKLRQRVAAVEHSKNDEVALIRMQYEQVLTQKVNEMGGLRDQMQRLQANTSQTIESLRGDCAELYAYVSRLHYALESSQRGQAVSVPKNVLADPHKLRHVKGLIASDPKRLAVAQSSSDASLSTTNGNTSAGQDDAAVRLTRPVSAPVRGSKVPTYPAMLRDRVTSGTKEQRRR